MMLDIYSDNKELLELRKQQVLKLVIEICEMIGTEKPEKIKRACVDEKGLKEWDFFSKFHSEEEGKNYEGVRLYVIETKNRNYIISIGDFSKYKEKYEGHYSIINFEDILKVGGIGERILKIKEIERECRKLQGINYTKTDAQVHNLLENNK